MNRCGLNARQQKQMSSLRNQQQGVMAPAKPVAPQGGGRNVSSSKAVAVVSSSSSGGLVPVSSARKALQDIGVTPQSASNNNEEDAPASLQVMGSITKVMNQIKGKIDTMSVVPSRLGGGNNSMALVAASPSGERARYDPQIPRNLSEEEVMQNHRRMLGSKPGRSEGCNIYAMVLRQKLNPNRNLDSRKGGISTMDSLFIMTGSLRDVKGSSLSDNPDGNVFVEEVEGHRERAVAIFSSFSRSYLKKKVGEEKQVLDSALRLKPFSSMLKPYTGYWLSGKGNPAVRVGDVIKLNNITLSTSEWRPPKKNDVPFVEAEFSTFCNFMNIEGVLSPYSAQGIVEAMEREGIITRWFITPARRNGIHTKAMVEARNPNVNMPLKPNDMLFIRIRGSIKDSVNNLNDNIIMEEEEEEEGGEEDKERARSGGDGGSVNNDDDGSEELTSYQQDQDGYGGGGGGGGASHRGSSSVGHVQQDDGGKESEDPYANGAIVTPLFTEREMANYNDYEKTTFYIEKTDPDDMKKKNRVLGFRLMCRVTQRESRSDPIIFGFVWVTAYTEVAEEFLAIGDVTAGTWFMSDYLKMLDFVLVCKVDEERTCKRTENDHDIHVNNFNRFVKPFDLLPYEKMWSENHKDIEKFYFMQPPDKLPYDVQQRYYGGDVDGGGVTGSPYEVVAEMMVQDQAGETPYMTVSHPDDDEEGGGGVEGDSIAMESVQTYGGNDGGNHPDSEAGAVVAQYGGEDGDDNDEFEGEEEERAGATAVEDSYIELVGNTAMADVGGGGGGGGGGTSGIVDRRRAPLFAYCADAQLVICDVYSFYMRIGIPVSAKMAVTLAKIWRHPQQLLATRRNTILLKTGVICLNDHNMPEETLNYEGSGRSKVHYRVVIDIENFDKSIEEIFASLAVVPPQSSSSSNAKQQQKACEEGDKFVTYLFKCLSPGEYTLPIPKNAEAGNHLLAVYNQLLKAHGKAIPGQSGARRIALPTNTPWANAVKLLIDSKKKFNISSGGLVFLMIDPGTRYVCESQTINAMFNGVYRFGKRKIEDSPSSSTSGTLTSGTLTSGASDNSVQDPPAKCARIEAVATTTTDDNAPEESSITKGTKKDGVQQQQTKRHPDSDDEVEEAEEAEEEEAVSSQDEDQD